MLSVIIATRNEEANLPACLDSLHEFDEIIVVDSHSTDKTMEIAQKHGAKIISFKWDGCYPKKRQWCLDNLPLQHDWVLFLDADERMTQELANEIHRLFQRARTPAVAGYFITGNYVWGGKKLRFGMKNRKIALLNKKMMQFPTINDKNCFGMGEIEGHYQPVMRQGHENKTIRTLKQSIAHLIPDKEQWLKRHKDYACWEACMNRNKSWPDDPVYIRQKLKKLFRALPCRSLIAFLHCYVLKAGFLDGYAGFDFALSRARYYAMIATANKQPD